MGIPIIKKMEALHDCSTSLCHSASSPYWIKQISNKHPIGLEKLIVRSDFHITLHKNVASSITFVCRLSVQMLTIHYI